MEIQTHKVNENIFLKMGQSSNTTNLKNTYLYGHNHIENNYYFNYRNLKNNLDDPLFTGFTLSIDFDTSPLFHDNNYSFETSLSEQIETYLKSNKDKIFDEGGLFATSGEYFDNTKSVKIGYGLDRNTFYENNYYGAIEYIYMVDKGYKDTVDVDFLNSIWSEAGNIEIDDAIITGGESNLINIDNYSNSSGSHGFHDHPVIESDDENFDDDSNLSDSSTSSSPSTPNKEAKDMPLLKKGSKGEDVKTLQKLLGVDVDGIFGSKTEAAVKEFQQKNKLKVDGKVGPETWGKLLEQGKASNPPAKDETKTETEVEKKQRELSEAVNKLNEMSENASSDDKEDERDINSYNFLVSTLNGLQKELQDIEKQIEKYKTKFVEIRTECKGYIDDYDGEGCNQLYNQYVQVVDNSKTDNVKIIVVEDSTEAKEDLAFNLWNLKSRAKKINTEQKLKMLGTSVDEAETKKDIIKDINNTQAGLNNKNEVGMSLTDIMNDIMENPSEYVKQLMIVEQLRNELAVLKAQSGDNDGEISPTSIEDPDSNDGVNNNNRTSTSDDTAPQWNQWSYREYKVNADTPQTVMDMLGFMEDIRNITTQQPYLFTSVSGLDSAYNKYHQVTDSYKGSGDDTITIDCVETLDMKMSAMFSKYFNAVYDRHYRRERVPVNLRRFNCSIFVHEIRNFRNALAKLNAEKFYEKSEGDNTSLKILELALQYMSCVEFKFYDCEIVPEDTGNIFGEISNEEGSGDFLHTSFSFKYGNCIINFLPFSDLISYYPLSTKENNSTEPAITKWDVLGVDENGKTIGVVEDDEYGSTNNPISPEWMGNILFKDYTLDEYRKLHENDATEYIRNITTGGEGEEKVLFDNYARQSIGYPDLALESESTDRKYAEASYHSPDVTQKQLGHVSAYDWWLNYHAKDPGFTYADYLSQKSVEESYRQSHAVGQIVNQMMLGMSASTGEDPTGLTERFGFNVYGNTDATTIVDDLGNNVTENIESFNDTTYIPNDVDEIKVEDAPDDLGNIYSEEDLDPKSTTTEIDDFLDLVSIQTSVTDELGYNDVMGETGRDVKDLGELKQDIKPKDNVDELGNLYPESNTPTKDINEIGTLDMSYTDGKDVTSVGTLDMSYIDGKDIDEIGKMDMSYTDGKDVTSVGKVDLSYEEGVDVIELGKVDMSIPTETIVTDLGKMDMDTTPIKNVTEVGTLDMSYTQGKDVKEVGKLNMESTTGSPVSEIGQVNLSTPSIQTITEVGKVYISTPIGQPLNEIGKLDMSYTEGKDVNEIGQMDMSYTEGKDVTNVGKIDLLYTDGKDVDVIGKMDMSHSNGTPVVEIGQVDLNTNKGNVVNTIGHVDLTAPKGDVITKLGSVNNKQEHVDTVNNIGKVDLSSNSPQMITEIGNTNQNQNNKTLDEFNDLGNVFMS
ncbi:MAG: peptidoglycan-binding protein [Lachnospiraceae bacterium]|nr:peptidoglycan-binding protein [Lachnospiraceae bacterium]